MTKRNANFNENVPKKFKVDENIDALWGEDLDEDDVDDCLLLATQMCEQNDGPVQRNNVSVVPNYSFFKQNGDDIFTSTQCNNNVNNNHSSNKATTSKFTLPTNNIQKAPVNVHELQKKIEKLENEYTAKEGEVSILRSQLKQVRVTLESEHQKKEKEWNEKFQVTSKELIATKSELDFKNLEVANLKNKITEVTKNHVDITLNGAKTKDERRIVEIPLKLTGSLEEQYPLHDKIDHSIFMSSKEEHIHINSKQALNNLDTQKDKTIMKQYEANVEYNNFKLEYIFPDISVLINSNRNSLNSDVTKEMIDKLLLIALEITKSFHKNLIVLKDNVQEETIRQRDLMYLDKKLNKLYITDSSIFGNEEWIKNEIGIKSRRIIAVIAEILPYSNYLRQLILQKSMYLNNNLDNLFNLFQAVIKIIGILRISERCVGFLCSVVLFMIKTTVTAEFCHWYVCVSDIVKEIIFARPPKRTLEYLSEFLKQSSLHIDFVRNMCHMTQHKSYHANSNEDILYYDEESCVLRVYTVLHKEIFINNKKNCKISMAVLHFIKQVLNSNMLWTHYNSSSNNCNCLRKIVKLGIKIIHETSTYFINERNKWLPNEDSIMKDYKLILKFSIGLLHIIKFKRLDIFNKYSVISQYKFIVKTLLDAMVELELSEHESETLRELNLREEVQTVNDDILDKIPIWN